MSVLYRPLPVSGAVAPPGALPLAGGPLWFTHAERIASGTVEAHPAQTLPLAVQDRLTAPRASLAGLDPGHPVIMGILNATPDSFSDGGLHASLEAGLRRALQMVSEGAHIVDIGGESTRPGAADISDQQEIDRTAPLIEAIRAETAIPVSIDTRKASVARAALAAGAGLVNDVSGFTYDPDLLPLCARAGVPVCVMHAKGDPATMQIAPHYDDVLGEVYGFLERQVQLLGAAGLPRARILVDPGIGFGKTQAHNLAILQNIALFHGLGCAILLGVSRKRFIGTIGGEPDAARRAPGSVAVGLAALAQGVQILRVHDVAETAQALRLWQAVR